MPILSFYLPDDDPLIVRLETESNASETIRDALRAWYGNENAVLDEIRAVRRLIESGVIVQAERQREDDGGDGIDEMMEGW